MSDIRDEIRAILREEIAALRAEAAPAVERVQISSTAELNRFARDLVARAASPDFSRAVAQGQVAFELTGPAITAPAITAPTKVMSPAPISAPTIEKAMITERDIVGLEETTRRLRLTKNCRLTPLARDEARRRGIRIERIPS